MPSTRVKILEGDTRKEIENNINSFFEEKEKSEMTAFQIVNISHNFNEPGNLSKQKPFWAQVLFNEFSSIEIQQAQQSQPPPRRIKR